MKTWYNGMWPVSDNVNRFFFYDWRVKMQLKQTVRKAKHVSIDMIIGIDTTTRVQGSSISKATGKRPVRRVRVYRKVQDVVYDSVRGLRYFVTRNSSGKLEFLQKNINDIVPVKVHPNTKEHKARR